jgi:hypothetical protein
MIGGTPAAARAVGASKTLSAFLCNFTSTPFIRICICKNINQNWNKLYDMWN